MGTTTATIEINASPAAVWAVLTDLARYPDWNPLFREATGQVAVGSAITLRSVHPASGRLMNVKVKVTAAEPGRELRWVSRLPGIMSGEHVFTLTESGGGTRLVQSETYGGLLAGLAGKMLASAHVSFQDLNEALKRRAEAA